MVANLSLDQNEGSFCKGGSQFDYKFLIQIMLVCTNGEWMNFPDACSMWTLLTS